MAAAREKTLAHSDLKRSLIGAILTCVLIGLRLPKAKMAGSLWVFPATQTLLFLGLCDVKAEQFFCLTIYKSAAVPYEEDLKYQTQDS